MATNSAQIAKSGKFGDLRSRLVFLLLALVVYRIGAHIPVPGIDPGQLKELFNKINDIEKGLEATLKGDNKIKAFVLSVPQKDATNAEIKYWVTSGSLANGFNERTLIQQFNIEKYAFYLKNNDMYK